MATAVPKSNATNSTSSNNRESFTSVGNVYPSVTYKQQVGTLSLRKIGLVFEADSAKLNDDGVGSSNSPSRTLKLKWRDIDKITANKAATSSKSILRLSHTNGKTSYLFHFTNRSILEKVREEMKQRWKQQSPSLTKNASTANTLSQSLQDLGEESMTETGFMGNSSSLLETRTRIEKDGNPNDENNHRRRSNTSAVVKKSEKAPVSAERAPSRSSTSKKGSSKQNGINNDYGERRTSLPVAAAEIAEGESTSGLPVVEATPAEGKSKSSTKEEPAKMQQNDPGKWSISYQQLLDIDSLARVYFGSKEYPKKTMRDVCSEIITPRCSETGTSYALSLNKPDGLMVDAFVTHSWDEPFGSFVTSIKDVFQTFIKKPNLWICAFALIQGDQSLIEKQLKGSGSSDKIKDSPFVRALQDASMYVVVRNSKTDLYSRIWCICELMYAKNIGLTTENTYITGPDVFGHLKTSCLDARAFDQRDKERILRVLLLEHNREEIDNLVLEYRTFGSPQGKPTTRSNHSWEDLTGRQKKMMVARALGCCLFVVIVVVIAVVVSSQSSNGSSSTVEDASVLRGSTTPITSVPTPYFQNGTASPSATSAILPPISSVRTPQPSTSDTPQPSPFPAPQPSPYPSPAPSVYCRGLPETIDVDNDARKTFDCDLGIPPVRFLWRTVGTVGEGFADDEYFINAYQDVSGSFVQIYRSPDQVEGMAGADGISGAIGTGEASRFRAEFECNLENPFMNCEGGTFEFAFVSCGCQSGQIRLAACVASSLETAQDVVCVDP